MAGARRTETTERRGMKAGTGTAGGELALFLLPVPGDTLRMSLA